MKIALVGNPNTGKSTIFNSLTGSNQKISNYPGVTVEKKSGYFELNNQKIEVVDLPGIYALSAYSEDEVIAKNFLTQEKPDILINIIDSSNIERNLYLTLQLMSLNIPMITVLNMIDVAKNRGIFIDIPKLTSILGIPVVPTIGKNKKAATKLKDLILNFVIDDQLYHVQEIVPLIDEEQFNNQIYIKLEEIISQTVTESSEVSKTYTDHIDTVVTHRFIGPFLLLFTLWLVYNFTFLSSDYLVKYFELFFSYLHNLIQNNLSDGYLKSVLTSAVIDGVGGVLSFTPLIMVMFLVIGIIEESGYLARISYMLDRILRIFGLHGSSILSYILSGGIAGGCAVPGVMATRTLKNPRERMATLLTAPFMNCGGKLPVYALLIAAFFSKNQGTVMFIITIFSWFVTLLSALIFRLTILKGSDEPFILELPPYRVPTIKSLLFQMWQKTLMYIKKAGTVILIATIALWVLMTFPESNKLEKHQLKNSYAGKIGTYFEPISKPLFGSDWRSNIALFAGVAAKEVIITTLGTAYSIEQEDDEQSTHLKETLSKSKDWNAARAFALIIFVMLYIPCLSVLSVMKKETNSWRWPIFTVLYTSFVAVFFASSSFHIISYFIN